MCPIMHGPRHIRFVFSMDMKVVAKPGRFNSLLRARLSCFFKWLVTRLSSWVYYQGLRRPVLDAVMYLKILLLHLKKREMFCKVYV